jgi:hypothetical protein
VDHDDGLGTLPHRVEELGLDLEVADRRVTHVVVRGVQDDVLAWVGRQPQVELPGALPQRLELRARLAQLAVELRQVRVRGVRGQ